MATYDGDGSNNTYVGTAAADSINGFGGNDSLSGLDGADSIWGGDGNDTVLGGLGNDTIWGGIDNDSLLGDAGDDSIMGEAGNDTMNGGAGHDTLQGGDGSDNLTGLDGNDSLDGGNNDDSITGGLGNDYLDGGDGNDKLSGDAGADTLVGGLGNDFMAGGAGVDTYYVDNTLDEVYEADTGLNDKVFASASFTIGAKVEILELTGSANINGKAGADANTLIGNTGNNWLRGEGGNDTLNGGAGNDTIVGGAGKDSMTGGAGDDVFLLRAATETTISSTTWDVVLDFGNDTLYGFDRIDVSMIDARVATAGHQTFTYIGTGAFTTANANGALRWDATNKILYGSTDADTAAEFAIKLNTPGGAFDPNTQIIYLDTTAPIFSSATTVTVAENLAAGSIVYRVAIEDGTATYSISDTTYFNMTSAGVVSLKAGTDHETRPSYSFTITATDAVGNQSFQTVTINVRDVDEVQPVITSAATASKPESATNLLYTATGTDLEADTSAGITWSISGTDSAWLNIHPTTGAVTLKTGVLNYEAKASYTFTVTANDGATAAVSKSVTVTLTNVDELGPVWVSGTTGTSVTENTAAGALVYTASATDNTADVTSGPITYSLVAGDTEFDFNPSNNQVTLALSPDYDTGPHSYQFTLRATDGVGNYTDRTVTVNINNVDEAAPTFTSGTTANAYENQGVLYTATSVDNDYVSGQTTYSILSGVGDWASVAIGAGSGVVTLVGGADLNIEAKEFYNFTVVATDAFGNTRQRNVDVTVLDINEFAPELIVPAVFSPTGITYTVEDDDGNSILTPLGYMPEFTHFGAVNDASPTTLTASEQPSLVQSYVAVTDGLNFVHVEAFVAMGSSGDDAIDASTSIYRAALYGFGGNDTIVGSDFNDQLAGGDGNDSLAGGDGNDALAGGAGNDWFHVTAGTDTASDMGDADGVYVEAGATLDGTVTSDLTLAAGSYNYGTANLTSNGNDVDLSAAALTTLGFSVTNTGGAASFIGASGNDTLTGGVGDDTINGGAGDDSILGLAGLDSIVGGSGSDYIDGGANNDTITGGTADDDWIVIGAGDDQLTDLSGGDVIVISAGATLDATLAGAYTATSDTNNQGEANLVTTTYAVNLSGANAGTLGFSVLDTGTDGTSITGSAGNDTLIGDTGNNFIDGGLGNDYIDAGPGNNTVTGGGGNDTLMATGGTLNLNDLGGFDVLEVPVTSTVIASIAAGGWTPTSATTNDGTVTLNTNGYVVDLTNVDPAGTSGWTVNNTGAATTITGSGLGDTINGGVGNDTILGRGGDDSITGGGGDDSITGGGENDTVTGGAGNDQLIGSAGADSLAGGADNDSLTGGADNDTLDGGANDDTLLGGGGDDSLVSGTGTDSMTGGGGNDTFRVQNGSTSTITDLSDTANTDVLIVDAGGIATASVSANWTATVDSTNSGTATVNSAGFNVNLAAVTGGTTGWTLNNTGAAARLEGSSFSDTVNGGTGADTLLGGAGADTVNGNDGTDSLRGGGAGDVMNGGNDNDTLAGDAGNDTLTGGAGDDTFTIANSSTDTITDLSGADVVTVAAGATALATVTAAFTATSATNNLGTATLTSAGFNVNLSAANAATLGFTVTNTGAAASLTGSAGNDTLNGNTGNDTIAGSAGNDTLNGNAGNDSLAGGVGNDLLDGGADNDTAVFSTSSAVTVDLGAGTASGEGSDTLVGIEHASTGAGADVLVGTTGNNSLKGNAGDDTIHGDAGDDTMDGGADTDTADFSAQTGAMTIDLAAGTATGAGTDTLVSIENALGGSGNDDISGTTGDNELTGGGGNDTFRGGGGDDAIDGQGGVADEAFFAGIAADYSVVPVTPTSFTVTHTASGDVSTLNNVELLTFADGTIDVSRPVHLVSGGALVGTYDTIQDAINASSNGDTINVAAGTYEEDLVVDKQVTIQGAGAGTIIKGDLLETNDPGSTYDYWVDWLLDTGATAYTGTGVGIKIQASNVTLKDLVVSDFTQGIDFDGVTVDNIDLDGVVLDGNLMGLRVNGATTVTNFSMTGGAITNGYHGVIVNHFGPALAQLAVFDGVVFDGVAFEHLAEKGIYVEGMNNAVLQDLTFDDVGNYGRAWPFGSSQVGHYGAAIDINMKFGAYDDIQMIDLDIQNSALSDAGTGTTRMTGAAISVKARDDGGTYGPNPATLTNVVISGGTIDGAPVAVRIGELNTANNAVVNNGPDVTITGVTFTDNGVVLADTTATPMSLATLIALNTVTGSAMADTIADRGGNTLIVSGAGNDTVGGGAGDDAIDGGADTDTVSYGAQTAAVTVDLGAGTASGTGIGSDTLANIENATGGSGSDNLTGSTGVNALAGGDGGDTITGGAGADTINLTEGSAAVDTVKIAFGTSEAGDVITGFTPGAGGDVIDFTGAADSATSNFYTVIGFNDVDNVSLGISSGMWVFESSGGPASLAAADIAAFLADINAGTGVNDVKFANAGDVFYAVLSAGGDSGVFRMGGSADLVIDAAEITLVARLVGISNAYATITSDNFTYF